ncbi:WD repeat-containing protein 76 [Phytophthora pseudosyringae]|uniref:WD repeat-containing protein 76 n=1 Tax=Phytophthora pseudosyringae TaxID=221518 RepID=A0A8T1WFB2_9STRA|nr:WD repeat-containing protein 76 [Phytophthora pseudosyringae]
MRRTRSSALVEASAPPQRLRSLRSSARNPPLSPPPVASLRRSSRRTPRVKLEPKALQDPTNATEIQDQDESGSEEEDEEEQEEQDAGLTEYERKRRENIQRNLAFMQQMGVSTAKTQARTAVGPDPATEAKLQQQALNRALQAARRAERSTQPVRKSRRLEGKKVEVEPIEAIDQYEMEKLRGPRPPRGSSLHVMDAVDGESKAFLGGITADLEEQEEELEEDAILDDDDGVEYTLADEDITKAVQERIYSVAFLPRADRVVVACGDKMGHVALWTPPSEGRMKLDSSASPLAVYRPHYTPVSQLIFPDSSKLVSSSFDGTVREFDLRAAESSVVYDTSDSAGISSLVAAGTAQCYYASCDDGTVRRIDRRTRKVQSSIYQLHEKKINTVHQHPSLDFCIATASLDRTVCLWDARKMSSKKNTPLVTLPHYRSVNCAYFSPRNGAWLVTVGQDSYIDMFDTSSLSERKPSDKSPMALPSPIRVRHNNITGRWLTKLHAAWDPKRPNQFVIGCMEHPRRIQIFRAGRRRPVRELKSDNFASVHSINAFHPHLELIAGGNSSGRLALWRGKKAEKDDADTTEAKGKVRVKTE